MTLAAMERPRTDSQQPKKKARIAPAAVPLEANDVIRLHFVSTAGELPRDDTAVDRAQGFEPAFTNQMFKEEQLVGYDTVQIDIAFATDSYVPILLHKHTAAKADATNYVAALDTIFPEGLPKTQEELEAAKAAVTPLSKVLDSCPSLRELHKGVTKGGDDISIYHTPFASASEAVRKLHRRLHPLLMFFIEAASAVDEADERAELFLAFKMKDGAPVAVVGFQTMFKFYAFPFHKRYRVAQILVMPPYQQQGIGRMMMEALNKMAAEDSLCLDIKYEDPADELTLLRERVDTERACALAGAWAAAQECVKAGKDELQKAKASVAAQASGSSSVISLEAIYDDGQTVSKALECPKAVWHAMRKSLKLSAGHVRYVWDCVLWAASSIGKACDEETVRDLLTLRLVHRELADATIKYKAARDQGIPENKTVLSEAMIEELRSGHLQEQFTEMLGSALGQGAGGAVDVEGRDGDAPAQDGEGAAAQGEGTDAEGAAGEVNEEEGEEEEDEEAEAFPQIKYLLYRNDLGNPDKHDNQLQWSDLAEGAQESVAELVQERLDAIERIVGHIQSRPTAAQ